MEVWTWGLGNPPLATQDAPASSSTPWGMGWHREGDTGRLEACAARVSAPGGEETPEADPGGGRSQISSGLKLSSRESGRRRGRHVQDLCSEQELERWTAGAEHEPKAGNEQIPDGPQPRSDFPR